MIEDCLTGLMPEIEKMENNIISVLSNCADCDYTSFGHGESSIGTHIRHVIEFIKAVNDRTDVINYDGRERNLDIETSHEIATDVLKKEITRLKGTVSDQDIQTPVTVIENGLSCPSTIAREICFIIGHSTHHLAFAKVLASVRGIGLTDDIGVAQATLQHRKLT